jgi:drug/metabolite transporter (DMT)-like permease
MTLGENGDPVSMPPSVHRRAPIRCFLVLVLVNLMWAFQFSGAKIATERLGPIAVALIPLAISTLLFAPLVRISRGKKPGSRWTPVVWRDLFLASTLGIIPAQLGLTWGVEHSLASNAAVLTMTIPVLTAMMAVMLLGERMTGVRWLSFALAIAGVLMVSDIDWKSVSIFRGTFLLGNLLILASCLGSAFYNTYTKKLLETFNPVELLVYSFLVTDVELGVLMLLLERPSSAAFASLGVGVWASLLTMAILSLSVSMLLYFWVIEKIDVTQASLSIYLLPVFGVLLSTVVVRERITAPLVVGGLLVFAATFLVTVYEERKRMRNAALQEKEEAWQR